MQRRLQRRDHRNVDQRAAAVDAEVERAERDRGVVAFALGLPERLVEDRRRRLDFRRPGPVEWTCRDPRMPTSTSAEE